MLLRVEGKSVLHKQGAGVAGGVASTRKGYNPRPSARVDGSNGLAARAVVRGRRAAPTLFRHGQPLAAPGGSGPAS